MNINGLASEIAEGLEMKAAQVAEVLDLLKKRNLLVDDTVVKNVAAALADAFKRGHRRNPSDKTPEQLAREALSPPTDPFEVAAVQALNDMGYYGNAEALQQDWPRAWAAVLKALRTAPKP